MWDDQQCYYEVSTKLVSMNWPHNELPLRHMILITYTCKPFVSISWRYPITKLENSDSAVYMTPHISALSCYTLYNMYKVPHKFFYLIIPVDQQETYQVFDSESEVCTVFSIRAVMPTAEFFSFYSGWTGFEIFQFVCLETYKWG